jgi:hypothetical protein
MATTYKLISSVTVGSGGATTMTFSSIPQTYTDLLLKISSRNTTGGADNHRVTFNGNTTNLKLINKRYSFVDQKTIYNTNNNRAFTTEDVINNNYKEKNNLSVKKDDIIIDVFYGWPYFNGTVLKSLSDGYNLTNAKNTNHLGGKAEYMLTENIGLGAEFTYANASIRYQSSINGFYEIAGVSKIRALGRFNYHFSATEMLDPYATFGIGYKRTTFYDTGSINTVSQSFNIF